MEEIKNTYVILFVMMFMFISCSINLDKESSSDADYILHHSDFILECQEPTADIDKGIFNPSYCNVSILVDENRIQEISKTPNLNWIELLNSDSDSIVKSTVIWLSFLQKRKIPTIEAMLIEKWTPKTMKTQKAYWIKQLNNQEETGSPRMRDV